MCTYGYGYVNYCNNENRSKVMCRATSLYPRLGGKFLHQYLRWHLPVFPSMENKSQMTNTGKYLFCHKILANMIFSCKIEQVF